MSYIVKGRIRGIAPILFNRYHDAEMLDAKAGSKKPASQMSVDEKRQESLLKVHRNAGNEIVIPKWMFKQCLVAGCQKAKLKDGRSALWSTFQALVFPEDASFGKSEPDFIHEHWGRIPPKTGSAAILRRPAFEAGWEVPIHITVADDRISPDAVRISLEHAGLLVGLGAWHPEYGRFTVTEITT